ncbi:protein-S-isoprenylcysteine O-methyltransferase Ste14 [Anaerotaenia torta]|uniref:methyltransferase family protein n=1 Tax=Anaerotaenia torta TaxID=433293 RepID=UPI003D261A63
MNEIKSGAVKYIGKMILQRGLGAAAFFLGAGTWDVPRGIAYFAVYIVSTVIASVILYRHDAELLNARRKVTSDTKSWDKVLLLIFVVLAFYGIYAAAGLSVRFHSPETSPVLFWIGMAIMALTCFLAVWPVMENRNFESSVRIQKDRGQKVCSTGPYAIIRHPGYSVILLWSVGMPMMFGMLAGMTAVLIVIVIVIRTYLEDTMLQKELPGYSEYTKKVRYRLLPYIW